MKKLFYALLAIVVLFIIAALAAPYFISAETIKKELIAKIEQATDRKLTIDGDLRLTFFPVAGVVAEKVTLSNPTGFSDATPFITLDVLKVDVALMPLLERNIVIQRFVLENPRLYLHQTKKRCEKLGFQQRKNRQCQNRR